MSKPMRVISFRNGTCYLSLDELWGKVNGPKPFPFKKELRSRYADKGILLNNARLDMAIPYNKRSMSFYYKGHRTGNRINLFQAKTDTFSLN